MLASLRRRRVPSPSVASQHAKHNPHASPAPFRKGFRESVSCIDADPSFGSLALHPAELDRVGRKRNNSVTAVDTVFLVANQEDAEICVLAYRLEEVDVGPAVCCRRRQCDPDAGIPLDHRRGSRIVAAGPLFNRQTGQSDVGVWVNIMSASTVFFMQTALAGHSSANCALAYTSADAEPRSTSTYPARRKKPAAVVVSNHNAETSDARAISSAWSSSLVPNPSF